MPTIYAKLQNTGFGKQDSKLECTFH